MSSKHECFNCLGECGGPNLYKFVPEGDETKIKWFCSKPCFKVSMREDLDIKEAVETMMFSKCCKTTKLLINSLKNNAPKRMIELYYKKFFEIMTSYLEHMEGQAKKNIITEHEYMQLADYLMGIKNQSATLTLIFASD